MAAARRYHLPGRGGEGVHSFQDPGPGEVVGRLDLGALGDEISFDRAFTQPIKKLYESGYDKPLLLFVDALDEALTYTGQINLAQLLAKLVDLPPQVRILASTRPDRRVTKYFPKTTPFDLIKNATPNIDDVRAYAVHRMVTVAPAFQ